MLERKRHVFSNPAPSRGDAPTERAHWLVYWLLCLTSWQELVRGIADTGTSRWTHNADGSLYVFNDSKILQKSRKAQTPSAKDRFLNFIITSHTVDDSGGWVEDASPPPPNLVSPAPEDLGNTRAHGRRRFSGPSRSQSPSLRFAFTVTPALTLVSVTVTIPR